MGSRDEKQIPEEELSLVSGGVSVKHGMGRRRQCPSCGSTNIETYRVGVGWRQRRLARCKNCGYNAGWSSFV